MNRSKKLNLIRLLPRYGSYATGLIYVLIGAVALLSLLQLREGGADESSILAILNDSIVGKVCIGFILIGLLSFVFWRWYEAIKDPYKYGNKAGGIIKRASIAISSLTDLFISFTAIRILIGIGNVQTNGQPFEERRLVAAIIENAERSWIIILIGGVYLAIAIIQFLYGVSEGYKERMNWKITNPVFLKGIYILGIAGYTARGLILGIIGFFFLKAYFTADAAYIVNTDKAFDFIGDELGHLCFVIVAAGTICYGLFMIALGFSYTSSKK